MTAAEALKMLNAAPCSDTVVSKVAKCWTQAQAINLIRAWINDYEDGFVLSPLMEKRVYQACGKRPPKAVKEVT
jgi:hypothetical protein